MTNFAQTQFSRSYPPKTHFLKNRDFTFFSPKNISFAGLKSKFLTTQQKFSMSSIHPINMKSIKLKLMKIKQIEKPPYLFPLTIEDNHNLSEQEPM